MTIKAVFMFFIVPLVVAGVVVLVSRPQVSVIEKPEPPAPQAMAQDQQRITSESTRIVVKRVAVITDDVAYHGQRGVYIITDMKTGAEYIGLSGVGITEVGSHTEGSGKHKKTVTDER